MPAALLKGQSYLIGFADTGLREPCPNLPWFVLASQEEREVVGPIRGSFALFVVILALLMMTPLGAYVFLHRQQKPGGRRGAIEKQSAPGYGVRWSRAGEDRAMAWERRR